VITLTRAKLEELTQEFIDRAMEITKRALEASPFKIPDIQEVILVGGQTRMPAMQKAVKEYFKKDPHMGVNPDEVVAIGAAIQGGVITGDVKDILFSMLFRFHFRLKQWEVSLQNSLRKIQPFHLSLTNLLYRC
jgi:molecular chaperone DnaK (HSP70)